MSDILTRIFNSISPKESFQQHDALNAEIAKRMKVGFHPLTIWQGLLGVSDDDMREAISVSQCEYKALSNHIDGAYISVSERQVLSFCNHFGVHPADLVPLDDSPELSLPHAILRSNVFVLESPKAKELDIKKARDALACERKRYNKFMNLGQNSLYPNVDSEDLYKLLDKTIRYTIKSWKDREPILVNPLAAMYQHSEVLYLNLAQLVSDRIYFSIIDKLEASEEKDKKLQRAADKKYEFFNRLFRATFFGLNEEAQTTLCLQVEQREEWTFPTLERFLHLEFINNPKHRVEEEFKIELSKDPSLRFNKMFGILARAFIEWRDLVEGTILLQKDMETLHKDREIRDSFEKILGWLEGNSGCFIRNLVANKIFMDKRGQDIGHTLAPDYPTRRIR